MNRAFIVIAIPALIVGAAYVALMVGLRAEVNWRPFIGLAVAASVALYLVRRSKAKREAKKAAGAEGR